MIHPTDPSVVASWAFCLLKNIPFGFSLSGLTRRRGTFGCPIQLSARFLLLFIFISALKRERKKKWERGETTDEERMVELISDISWRGPYASREKEPAGVRWFLRLLGPLWLGPVVRLGINHVPNRHEQRIIFFSSSLRRLRIFLDAIVPPLFSGASNEIRKIHEMVWRHWLIGGRPRKLGCWW